MKRFFMLAVLLLPVLAACGGGSTPKTLESSGLDITAASQNGTVALSEAQSDAMQGPQPLYTPSAADLLYVGNVGNNSITVYHHDAQGNTLPLKVIEGSNTGINNPGQLSEDAQGNLYVANTANTTAGDSSILVFAHGANGNAIPIRKLSGPLTGIHTVTGMTVDRVTGKMFAMDSSSTCGFRCSNLLRFPPNATGNTAPFARSGSLNITALQLDSDSTGQDLIEVQAPACCSSPYISIETYPKQFANGAPLGAVYSIAGFFGNGIADDPTTKTYLATTVSGGAGGGPAGIYRFAENTVGYTADNYGGLPASFKPSIVSIITSETCGRNLALGYLRNIYVVHNCPGTAPAVNVYTHDSSGSVAPLRVLSGTATRLNQPYGIYEGE